jgi:hypothetical protein
MQSLSFAVFSSFILLSSLSGCAGGGDVLTAKQAGTDGAKLVGKKIKVKGVYTQGFSDGGRPTDPWALVIADGPAIQPTVSCLIPAKTDMSNRYPKITAEGTVRLSSSGRVYLDGCTYKVED